MRCIVYAIHNIRKHPTNDKLYLADVGPHQIITGCEADGSCHYYEGQLGFFIPDGTIVPDKLAEEMEILGKLAGKKKNRVKAKIRDGQRSDGLFYGSQGPSWGKKWREGDDVTEEVLGVEKEILDSLENFTEVLKSGETLEKHFRVTKIYKT